MRIEEGCTNMKTLACTCIEICAIWSHGIVKFNPHSVMLTIWHRTIISFKVLTQKGQTWFNGTWISWVKCISERLPEVESVFWCVDVGHMGCNGRAAHTSDIHPSWHHKSSWHSGGLICVSEGRLTKHITQIPIVTQVDMNSDNWASATTQVYCNKVV